MSRSRLVLVLPWLGLAGVGVALASGVAPARLRFVTGELLIAIAAAAYARLAGRAARLRASRQRTTELAWEVRLQAPLWLRLYHTAHLVALGALVAALPAAFGWTAFSVGVFVTLATAAAGVSLFSGFMVPVALTFQTAGLRVHYSGVSVLVPWDDVQRIEVSGPDHFTMLSMSVRDPVPIVASADPPTAAARRRAETVIGKAGMAASFMMMPWTAGVDGLALQRAIENGRAGRKQTSALN